MRLFGRHQKNTDGIELRDGLVRTKAQWITRRYYNIQGAERAEVR